MKIFLSLFILLISIGAYSQSQDYRIIPVQAGSTALINGKATVNLDEKTSGLLTNPDNTKNTYYVVLTPIDNCGLLKITEKGNTSFTVIMAGPGSSNGSFDYMVFLRYPVMHLNPTAPSQPLRIAPAEGK